MAEAREVPFAGAIPGAVSSAGSPYRKPVGFSVYSLLPAVMARRGPSRGLGSRMAKQPTVAAKPGSAGGADQNPGP